MEETKMFQDQIVLVGNEAIFLGDVYAAGFEAQYCRNCGYWFVDSKDEAKLLAWLNK